MEKSYLILGTENDWFSACLTIPALQFTQAKSQVQVLGYHGQIQHGAYEKVLDILNQMNAARGGTASSQTATALMGDLSSFQLAMDRVKSEYIQTL